MQRVLPPDELSFIQDATESKLFTQKELQYLENDLSSQFVSLKSLEEQERILEATNDLIDRHGHVIKNYPSSFNYLLKRQAAQAERLKAMRERLTMVLASEGATDTELSQGSRLSKGSNASRVASNADVPGFRSLPTPRMGGGLT